jgi:pyruvate formate lyase activating enzyme
MNPDRWKRREFLRVTGLLGCACASGLPLRASPDWLVRLLAESAGAAGGSSSGASKDLAALIRQAPTARYWTSTAQASRPADCAACHAPGELAPEAEPVHEAPLVRCLLCARNCTLREGERGHCRARMHVGGELKSLVYGRPISIHVDPIEKKPFYHFLPATPAFSMATSGCPLRCKFCQNWEISQARPEDYGVARVPPERIVDSSVERKAPVIAFTYNEPTVFFEYLADIARAARPRGLRSVLVSCGYMNERPLAEMCDLLDAIKIDLKGYSETFYERVCGARLQPVLRSIRQVAKSGRHLELVNLVVPTLNDDAGMLDELARWVVGELGPDVPVHFTRFHPDYQLPNLPPTPVSTLERAREIALKHGMHYAYVGNVPGHPGNHTYCPGCGKVVIARSGFFVTDFRIKGGKCADCAQPIAGVWS